MQGEISADAIFIYLYFPLKIDFDISCKLAPKETIDMKCERLFPGKSKKNISNLPSAELAQRAVKVKEERNFTC